MGPISGLGDELRLDFELDSIALVLCPDAFAELGLLEYGGKMSWRVPAPPAGSRVCAADPVDPADRPDTSPFLRGSAADVIGRLHPFTAGHDQQKQAHELAGQLLAALCERPGECLAMADLAPAVGLGPKDAMTVFIGMRNLVQDGRAVQHEQVDGAGPAGRRCCRNVWASRWEPGLTGSVRRVCRACKYGGRARPYPGGRTPHHRCATRGPARRTARSAPGHRTPGVRGTARAGITPRRPSSSPPSRGRSG